MKGASEYRTDLTCRNPTRAAELCVVRSPTFSQYGIGSMTYKGYESSYRAKASCRTNHEVDIREVEEQPDPVGPEREMLRQLIIRTIQDATGNFVIGGNTAKGVEEEALDWVFEEPEKTADPHFTFHGVCFYLNLNPDDIKHFINNAREDNQKLIIFDDRVQSVDRDASFRPWQCRATRKS